MIDLFGALKRLMMVSVTVSLVASNCQQDLAANVFPLVKCDFIFL